MTARAWLVGYDVTSPKRLRRVHHFLVKRAFPLQYSLFLAVLSRAELDELLRDVATLIHPRRDDVRAWPLPENAEFRCVGRGAPEGIHTMLAGTPGSLIAMATTRPPRS